MVHGGFIDRLKTGREMRHQKVGRFFGQLAVGRDLAAEDRHDKARDLEARLALQRIHLDHGSRASRPRGWPIRHRAAAARRCTTRPRASRRQRLHQSSELTSSQQVFDFARIGDAPDRSYSSTVLLDVRGADQRVKSLLVRDRRTRSGCRRSAGCRRAPARMHAAAPRYGCPSRGARSRARRHAALTLVRGTCFGPRPAGVDDCARAVTSIRVALEASALAPRPRGRCSKRTCQPWPPRTASSTDATRVRTRMSAPSRSWHRAR